MLQRQEVNKDPAIRRQLFYDASQQHYLELFVVREFVHTGTAAGGLNRILPLTSLGVGHFTSVDKALALLHSISLESGRHRPSMQRYVDSARVQAIDGGAESWINDVPDLIDIFSLVQGIPKQSRMLKVPCFSSTASGSMSPCTHGT